MLKKCAFFCGLLFIINMSIPAQTHISVPLENPIYIVIEQAQIRGLCGFLPATKPYSQAMILSIIEEILSSDPIRMSSVLKDKEREILEQFRKDFTPGRSGLNLIRGKISSEHTWNDIYFSGVFGFGMDFSLAASFYPIAGGYHAIESLKENNNKTFEVTHPASGDFFTDFNIIAPHLSFIGDLGKNVSYGFTLNGFIGKSPRVILGLYETTPYDQDDKRTYYQSFPVYSNPLAYFPYTYKKKWDGFVFPANVIKNYAMSVWPDDFSLGYSMLPELSGTFFNGHFMYRFARLDREWSGPINNGSLILNQAAQPFLAFETVIIPFNWISFSSLTGALEYNNAININNIAAVQSNSAISFQNAFSIVMLDVSYKKYFKVSLGSSVIWPKRFELGYPFPFSENFLYQNNIGDFDNMALFLNLEGHPAGLGKIWFSAYIDEVSFESNFLEKDRTMYAFQFGGSFYLPLLPFTSLTLSYTKIEPYNYTHNRVKTPWYGDNMMETNYINFGRPLGYYLPPNTDEILFRIQTIPFPRNMMHLQYQMIRHGADYGDRAVDGSSYWSELKLYNRSTMMKYFLQDGAYQWMHIFKLGGEYSFTGKNLPFKLTGEIGGVYSYFTDTGSELGTKGDYSIINTPQYPHSLSFIAFLGIQIFPKF